MFMTGTRDSGGNETESPDWRRTAYENSPAGDKYFVLIRNAGHMTFTGLASGLGQDQPERTREAPIVDPRTGQVLNGVPQDNNRNGGMITDRGTFGSIRSISLMFWDSYLKNKADAKALLDPTKYAGSVEFSRKEDPGTRAARPRSSGHRYYSAVAIPYLAYVRGCDLPAYVVDDYLCRGVAAAAQT